MSTETTRIVLPASYEYSVKYVEKFVRRCDTWKAICAEAKAGDTSRYNPRTRMPSKQNKGWAYDEAGKITRALGLPRCSTVEDLRAAAAAGRAALVR